MSAMRTHARAPKGYYVRIAHNKTMRRKVLVCDATRDTRAQRYHIIFSKAKIIHKVASSVHTVRSTLPRQRSAACFASESRSAFAEALDGGVTHSNLSTHHAANETHKPDPTTTRNSPRSFSRQRTLEMSCHT